MMYTTKRLLRFNYVAIKRYGDRFWAPYNGVIEINPSYTVCVGECDRLGVIGDEDKAYMFELSNGTKFIALINDCVGPAEILSEQGEFANSVANEILAEVVRKNISKLNFESR